MVQREEDEDVGVSDPDWDDLADDADDVSDVNTGDVDLDDLGDDLEDSQSSGPGIADEGVASADEHVPATILPATSAVTVDVTQVTVTEQKNTAPVSEIQPIDSPSRTNSPEPVPVEAVPALLQAPTPADKNWSWGTAWSTISAAIHEDVQDLTHTFQRAIDNVKDEIRTPLEDEDDEAAVDGSATRSAMASAPEYETDQELEDGLQAIDEQVDKLASGAVKALGSLWSGLGGAINSGLATAGNVASRVEHAALQAASTVIERVEQPRALGSSNPSTPQMSRHGPGAWDLLRRVGQMFEGQDSPHGFADASGLSEDDWDMIHHLDAPENAASVSFEQLFKVYRGHRFEDELEDFGNEAAKECNRTRATLSGAPLSAARKAELDATMALLAAIVDLSAHLPPSRSPRSASAGTSEVIAGVQPSSEKPDAAINEDASYAALAGLCSAAVQRANLMGERAAIALRDTLHLDSTAPMVGDDTEAIHDAWGEVQDRVFMIRAEGLKLLAEFSSLALQHLIILASSLRPNSSADGSNPAFQWPAGDSEKGILVKGTIQQLLADINAICTAFCNALNQIGKYDSTAEIAESSVPPSGEEGSKPPLSVPSKATLSATASEWITQLTSVADSLVMGLEADCADACDKLIAASKHLLYPVCVACVQRLTAKSAPDAAATATAPVVTQPPPADATDATEALGEGIVEPPATAADASPVTMAVLEPATEAPAPVAEVSDVPAQEDADDEPSAAVEGADSVAEADEPMTGSKE